MADEASTDLGIEGLGPAVRIGSGGFADVYRAQQTNLRRDVAVKILRAPADAEQARMRFERECHALGAVSGHPNIVGVHGGGFTGDGRAYLVMEYYPGGSLLDRLQREGTMAEPEVVEIGRKIGRALEIAHQAGVLHRDVKPANILISAYGEPGLADFGIARVEGGQQTATGMVTASFAHAAPEVLEGKQASVQSDLYSLGSTLFELFTGQAPHVRPDDESVFTLMNRAVNEPVPDPAVMGMTDPLAVVVRQSTLHQPTERQRTAAEVVTQLEATSSFPAVGGTGPEAPPTRPSSSIGGAPTVADPPPLASTSGAASANAAPPVVPFTPPQADDHRFAADHSAPPHPSTEFNRTAAMAQVPVAAGTDSPTVAQPAFPSAAPASTPPHAGAGASVASVSPPSRRRGRLVAALLAIVAIAAAGAAAWFVFGPGGTTEPLPIAFDFPAGSSGPLEAGVVYALDVDGADDETRFRLVVDGEPVGQPAPALDDFTPEAGRHSVAIEVTTGDTVRVTEPVEVYVIGELPDPGFRANLASVQTGPGAWPGALASYDRLVDQGHDDLELLPSDWFPDLLPGFWNLYVPGFGDDRDAATAYCRSFGLDTNDDCFVSFFDPNA